MRFTVYVAAYSATLFCANVVDATQLNSHTDNNAIVGVKVEAPVETEPVAETMVETQPEAVA